MKNKPPLKRHPAIVSFSKDHHFGLLLVWKIRQGLAHTVDPIRISSYVSFFFKEDLLQHFKEEETWLFSKISKDDNLRIKAEHDHKTILGIVASINDKPNNIQLLQKLADELENHIRFEEREFFNHLQNKISNEELNHIAERMPSSNKDIDAKWNDAFWEKKN